MLVCEMCRGFSSLYELDDVRDVRFFFFLAIFLDANMPPTPS